MSSSLSKRGINRQLWFDRIETYKQSGLTQKAFCEQHHLGLSSFQRWRRIFLTEGQAKASSPITFLPVNVMARNTSRLTLRINNTLRIEIPGDFDPAMLKQVVQVLLAA